MQRSPSSYGLRAHLMIVLLLAVMAGCTGVTPNESAHSQTHWRKLGPGGGGSTFYPVFSAGNPDFFTVRCDMTGTYITTDGGASYHQANFPNGSSTYAYDPRNDETLYLGTSALFRSDDSGRSWTQLFPHPSAVTDTVYQGDHASFRLVTTDTLYNADPGRITKIRVDDVDASTLYFAKGNSIFVTHNAGSSWQRIPLGEEPIFIYSNQNLLNDTLLIFSETSVFLLNKRTQEFRRADLPTSMVPAYSFTGGQKGGSKELVFYALHNPTAIVPGEAFGETQIWISNDGQNWQRTSDDISNNRQNNAPPSYSLIAAAEDDAAHAYVVTDRYMEADEEGTLRHWYGSLKTGDAGETWKWVWKGGGGSGRYGVKDGKGVENLTDSWVEDAFGGEYIRLLEAGVYPGDGNIAVVTDWYRTMKTTDGGMTWHEVYSIKQPDNTYVSRGMDVTTAYGVHFDPFDKNHIAISYTDIGYHHSFDGGKTWQRSVEGVPGDWVNTCYWVVFDPDIEGKLWSGWSNLHDFPRGKMTRSPRWKSRGRGGVCVSTDGGRSWSPVVEGMGSDSPTTSLVMDPRSEPGKRTLYAAVYNKGVFKSVDDGNTWTLKNTGIDANTTAFELTLAPNGDLYLTVVPTPVHAEGKTGTAFHSGAVYKSVDGAETWKKLRVNDGPLFPNAIEVDPENPGRVYLACWAGVTLSDLVGGNVVRTSGEENKLLPMPGGIFLSEDGGESWNSIFDSSQYVYDVSVDPRNPGRLYCNTFNQSAWRSDDYGKSWTKLPGYDFHWGHRVMPDVHDPDFVYITTYGSSVLHGKPGRP